jgi:peptidoglycan/LPS O-acetylase OafA/YrhL
MIKNRTNAPLHHRQLINPKVHRAPFGLPAALVVLGAMQIDAKSSAWIYHGGVCYSLYVTHILPIQLLQGWWQAHSIGPDLIVVIGSAVLFAWRMHERFEIPLLNLLDRGRDLALRFRVQRVIREDGQ